MGRRRHDSRHRAGSECGDTPACPGFVQKLKRIGEGVEFEGVAAAQTKKLSILGALTLYLDFINIFLFLLRMAGNRR